jgi:hypothetical protein
MEKKEFPKTEGDFQPKTSGITDKLSWLYNKSFGVIKFILGVCLLPFVYSSTVSFLNELNLIEKPLQNYFWSGVVVLLLIYLFVWEPAIIYTRGYRLLELIFNFFKPLVRVAPYLLPIYTIILFIIYMVLSLVVKSRWLIEYSIFLLGLTITLHLVFSAKTIRSKKGDFLKANYIFGFSFIYLVNLIVLTFCLNLIFKEFSFVNFCNNSFQLAKNIFGSGFRQLFL